ncbi:SLBB domain-containing protein [Massilia solisilvae]|uniref:SLBB domain-containing protein n=1 Tax=Massilia solisilvae TaxID=1811225 RepID=A0ABT2BEN7_9BURK|nr:SLBB domain-containing protein [Massilia solisilvae]MCS0606974.1 SLBB domain-containing protein [Massilia solisilvae]
MYKIKTSIIAVALATASIASAQDKSDLFGQEAVTATDVATPQAPRKLTINNTSNVRAASATPPAAVAAPSAKSHDEPSEFQKFISENTGQMLPVFGSEFFAGAPSTFAPISNSPVPADYPLGPGDELLIRGWGTIDIDYRATIDRNGTISIPSIGSVVLAGVKAGEAESVIRGAIGKLYKGVTVNVNFGQLRAITVYVVGQARRPGTYTVSSLSTLVTALFASGGPNANGSMRHVQVKRGGKVAAELDLYSFIAKGDKSADIKLLDGDTIFIPPAGGFVALVGKVNAPAVYELKNGNDTVESLLDFAGGLPVVADPRRAFLERINATRNHPRSVEEFALDGQGLKRPLRNGDVLNITSITPDFANAVVLRGNVDQPIRAQFKSGMRVSDLIPSREYLISRASVRRQNNVVATGDGEKDTREVSEGIAARIGGLIDEINWDYAVVERVNRSDLSVNLIPFNLGNVFANPKGADNVELQAGDTVTIFSQSDVAVPLDKRRVFVRVEGEVKVPGVYQMTAGETLQSLIAKAGGPTSNAYLFGTAFFRESVRREQQANLEKAADKLEAQLRDEQAKSVANTRALTDADAMVARSKSDAQMELAKQSVSRFRQFKATGRIAFGLDPEERSFARLPQLKLENGDRLVVPPKPQFVHVFGAVNVEASPLWRPNTRVDDYLKLAGLTPAADTDNVFVMRVDGTVESGQSKGWFFGGIGGVMVMPGDSILVPEKIDKDSRWTKFMQGTREWAQIFANFGLGAAAIKTLRN